VKLHRWLVWTAFLVGWTLLLTLPVPRPLSEVAEQHIPGGRYAVAKTVHVLSYALFTILSGWLRTPLRYRPLLMFALMAHATLTEHLQVFLVDSQRQGSLFDVAFDNAGVLLGFLVSWTWWTGGDEAV
jgi:VanZ family protein